MLGAIVFPSGNFFVSAQAPGQRDPSVEDSPMSEVSGIQISRLGPPPTDFDALIESGNVSFDSGDRDPSLEPKEGPGVAAETHYRIAYHFKSHSHWTLRQNRLTIRMRFRDVQWDPSHRIWFRQTPSLVDFWNQPLVRHEFDHVRISSDPRFKQLFVERLNETSVIRHDLDANQKATETLIDELVEAEVARIFGEVSSLIAIRYKELDRVTDHGRTRLPEDFFDD